MSINAAGVTQAVSLTTDVLALFNGWDLQNAQYNGVNFYIANAIPGISSSTLNAYAQTVNSVIDLFGGGKSFPLNSSIPTGTQMFLKGITDSTQRSVIVHKSMNSNTNILEDAGFEPEKFTVLGIISGDNYYAAYNNLYNYFTARRGDIYFNAIPTRYQNVLTHPVRGDIQNVLCDSLKVVHSSAKYKAVVFTATFIAAEIGNIKTAKSSWANQIQQGLSAVLNTVAAVENAIADAQLALRSVSAIFKNPPAEQSFNKVVVPNMNNTTVPMLNATGTIMYQNLSNPTQTNYYFKQQQVDYTQLPQLIPFSYGFTIDSISSLLSIYEIQVQSNITSINNLGYNVILNDLIASLRNSYVATYNLGQAYSQNNQSTYLTYTVPKQMSIRMVCFLNGIDFNNTSNLDTIYKLNADKFTSVNFIPANTTLILPNTLV